MGDRVATGGAATAAEINVVTTAGPVPEVMDTLAPVFERASGHKLKVRVEGGPRSSRKSRPARRPTSSSPAPTRVDELVKAGSVAAATSAMSCSRASAWRCARARRSPTSARPRKFKAALFAAKSVAYSQGASGQHFATVIARLGIVEQMKPKTVMVQRSAGRRGGGERRGRDRRAAGRRALAGAGHHFGRCTAGRSAEGPRLYERRSGQGQGADAAKAFVKFL